MNPYRVSALTVLGCLLWSACGGTISATSDAGAGIGAGSGSSGGSGGSSSNGDASMTEAGPDASAPLAPPIAVSVGHWFTCALLDGGTVACWGNNSIGQFGDGTSNGPQSCYGFPGCSDTPVAVADLTDATAISAGGAHACALRAGGTVECWGWNGYGQLGDGTSSGPQMCSDAACSTTPVMVSDLMGVTAISAGWSNTCALLTGGTVACWGDNSVGELGNGTTSGPQTCNPPGYPGGACSPAPVVVPGLTGVVAVSAGYQYACALLAGGTVACWGWNDYGELGIDGSSGPQMCAGTPCSTTPVTVPGVTGATAISAGLYSACALLSGGTVMCWGWSVLGGGTSDSLSPVTVPGLTGATAMSTSGADACALFAGGTVACWGLNDVGELGDGTSTGPQMCPDPGATPPQVSCSTTPVAVSGLTGVTAMSAGQDRTCALLSGGTVMCWGLNDYGALGDGTTTGPETCYGGAPCSTTPVEVLGL